MTDLNNKASAVNSEPDYGSIARTKSPSKVTKQGNELYGYALMVTGCFFFDIVTTVARACMVFHGLTAANLVFLRGTSHFVYCLLGIFLFFDPRKVFYVPKEMRWLLLLRAIIGSTGIALVYKALSYVPMAVIVCVMFMDPIITLVLSAIFLGERMSLWEAGCAVVSIAGVLLVSNPELKFPHDLPPLYVFGLCLQITASALFASQLVLVRVLAKKVHFMCTTVAMGIPLAFIGWCQGGANLPGFTFPVRLSLFGCACGSFAYALMNKSLQYSRASTASLMSNVDLPFAYGMSVMFLGEIPHFMSWVGAVLVITGCIGVALGAIRKENEHATAERNDNDNTV